MACLLSVHNLHAQTPAQGHSGAWYNADSSNKLALEFAGGYAPALGVTKKSQQHGWNYTMAGGYNVSKRLGFLLEYGFVHSSTPDSYLLQQFSYGDSGSGAISADVRVWSITAEPVYHFWNGEKNGAYVLAGGGFYRKHTILRDGPSTSYCDSIFPLPCYVDTEDLTNNAGGINAGIGIAHRVGTYNNAKLFLEARYVFIDNQPSPNNTVYAAANQRTTYAQLIAGMRF